MLLSRATVRALYRGPLNPSVPRYFTSSTCTRQVHPRGPYYDALMDQPTPSEYPLHPPIVESSLPTEADAQTKSHLEAASPTSTPEPLTTPAIKEISITDRELGPEERAKLLFGSPLTGPERMASLKSQGTTINGVFVPKKPEEPDNCCMSGCVNCVWDMYQEEMNEWQTAMKKARAVGKAMDMEGKLMIEKVPATSLDSISPQEQKGKRLAVEEEDKDPFEGVPVGIRQFMATEKKIRVEKAEAEAERYEA